MKVYLLPEQYQCLVVREDGDPVFSGVRNAKGESRLLYHVKQYLNQHGYDFIKKRMWRDGHLVDDMQQYLRERKPVDDRMFAIYNTFWQIEGADEALRRDGKVVLGLTNLWKGYHE
jgi:hypothetical protein